jgi:TPR repeat protein
MAQGRLLAPSLHQKKLDQLRQTANTLSQKISLVTEEIKALNREIRSVRNGIAYRNDCIAGYNWRPRDEIEAFATAPFAFFSAILPDPTELKNLRKTRSYLATECNMLLRRHNNKTHQRDNLSWTLQNIQDEIEFQQDCIDEINLYNRLIQLAQPAPDDLNQLAKLFIHGKAIGRNVSKGIEYLKQAIQAGSLIAIHNLALVYESYRYGYQNMPLAIEYRHLAIRLNAPDAIEQFNAMYLRHSQNMDVVYHASLALNTPDLLSAFSQLAQNNPDQRFDRFASQADYNPIQTLFVQDTLKKHVWQRIRADLVMQVAVLNKHLEAKLLVKTLTFLAHPSYQQNLDLLLQKWTMHTETARAKTKEAREKLMNERKHTPPRSIGALLLSWIVAPQSDATLDNAISQSAPTRRTAR